MPCQLDYVKRILDMAVAVRSAVLEEISIKQSPYYFSRRICSVIYGLLLINEYDVFIQKGKNVFWLQVYIDGEPFILDAAVDSINGDGNDGVLFLPEEEALGLHGYSQGTYYDWGREDCEETVWRSALDRLGIDRPAGEVLREIAEAAF